MSDDVKTEAVNDFVNQSQGESETPAVDESVATPAGVENTEKASTESSNDVNLEGQKIPYSRFKEVNDTKKDLETKVKEYEERLKGFDGYTSETLSVYKDFDNFVSSIPDGSEKLKKWISDMSDQINNKSNPVETSKETDDDEDYESKSAKEIKEMRAQIAEMKRFHQEEQIGKVKQGYADAYSNLTKDKNFSDEEHLVIQNYITKHLVQNNRNYMSKVDYEAVRTGFTKAEEILNKIKNNQHASTTSDDVNPPVNEGGVSGVMGVDMKDKASREKFLQEGFKNIKL
ncbi:MAG: hypothetical protein B6226_05875 [Candidatus Cloacimonetes bacterium 4572_65]|nr:MAG: hypothetical protein B6226_05875 [Candidatus Cloacimonetes bacterium 4572_65]